MPAITADAELHELLTRTVGPACHELRSPLAVVYGFAKMLEGKAGIDDTSRRYVSSIVESAQRLDELLDELGGVGRIAAGRSRPDVQSTSVATLIAAVRELPANVARMRVQPGEDAHVCVDGEWARHAVEAVVDALCYDESATVDMGWTVAPEEVQLMIRPGPGSFAIDVSPERSSLQLALARMRLRAMGGSIEGEHDGAVRLTLPR